MKLIVFVFFFLSVGALVRAIPREPSEVSLEDELRHRGKRNVLTEFARQASNFLDNEIKEESESLPLLSKRAVPADTERNISDIIQPLRDQLKNVSFGELVEALENFISNSTNNTSAEIQDIIRRILDLPILGDIIGTGSNTTGFSTEAVTTAIALIFRVIAILPEPELPTLPIPPLPMLPISSLPIIRPPFSLRPPRPRPSRPIFPFV